MHGYGLDRRVALTAAGRRHPVIVAHRPGREANEPQAYLMSLSNRRRRTGTPEVESLGTPRRTHKPDLTPAQHDDGGRRSTTSLANASPLSAATSLSKRFQLCSFAVAITVAISSTRSMSLKAFALRDTPRSLHRAKDVIVVSRTFSTQLNCANLN